MRQLRDAQLAQWITASLRAALPRAVARLSARSVADVVCKAIENGRALGLRYDEDLLLFARVHLLLGRKFQTDPGMRWAHAYLEDWDPDVGERVARLEAEALRRQAGAAL